MIRRSASAQCLSALHQESKEEVLLFSLDADGAIFNEAYESCEYKNEKDRVLSSNLPLINDIIRLTSKNPSAKRDFMVGSNRQSPLLDKENSTQYKPPSTSVFNALNIIAKYCFGVVDPLLLSDVFCGRESGFNYNNKNSQDYVPWEDNKIILLYLQMQHAANKYPDKNISLHFYDDNDEILNNLSEFYLKYPNLIPANVTINLHQYDGVNIINIPEIKSANVKKERDKNYLETVKACLYKILHPGETPQIPACLLVMLSKIIDLHAKKIPISEIYSQFTKEEMTDAKKLILQHELHNLMKIFPSQKKETEQKNKEQENKVTAQDENICLALKNIIFNTDWDIFLRGESVSDCDQTHLIPEGMLPIWGLIEEAQKSGNWSEALNKIQEKANIANKKWWSIFRSDATSQFYEYLSKPSYLEQISSTYKKL